MHILFADQFFGRDSFLPRNSLCREIVAAHLLLDLGLFFLDDTLGGDIGIAKTRENPIAVRGDEGSTRSDSGGSDARKQAQPGEARGPSLTKSESARAAAERV